jgi:hypothetical protein
VNSQLEQATVLKINAPHWFRRNDFRAVVESPQTATWWNGDPIDEWSDIFVTYDNGEGSNYGGLHGCIPDDIWDEICRVWKNVCGDTYGLVWITNLEDGDER